MITQLPDLQTARSLLRWAWVTVEAQGGRFIQKSDAYLGSRSTPAVLVRTAAGSSVLIYAQSYETDGEEQFGLRFEASSKEWPTRLLSGARPPFGRVSTWSKEMEFPFATRGPDVGELGLGSPVNKFVSASAGEIVPLRWALFRTGPSRLVFFADQQVSTNVGISSVHGRAAIRKAQQETVVVKI